MIRQTLEDYIYKKYKNNRFWFEEEVKEQRTRISKIFDYKNYLNGQHKILNKADLVYKNKEFKTRKVVLNEVRNILDFNKVLLLGKDYSFTGSENKVKVYNNLYRKGKYSTLDFKILDKVQKFGTLGEYVYPVFKGITNKVKSIESRIIQAEDFYPVFSDSFDYICAIEHWVHKDSKIDYYRIYSMDKVEEWDNEGGLGLTLRKEYKSYGLPILWKNNNDTDERYGKSELDDLIPLVDDIESILNKLGDTIHTIILNPMLHVDGKLKGNDDNEDNSMSMDVDGVGYSIWTLQQGKTEFVNASMDYNNIKLYLDKLFEALNKTGAIPSAMYGQSNIANVSETAIKQLYQIAMNRAVINEKWFKEGLQQRWDIIDEILENNGISFSIDEYIDVQFNYSRPSNDTETVKNLVESRKVGMMSIKDCIEKNPMTSDVQQTIERLREEGVAFEKVNKNESRVNDNKVMNNKSENSKGENVV